MTLSVTVADADRRSESVRRLLDDVLDMPSGVQPPAPRRRAARPGVVAAVVLLAAPAYPLVSYLRGPAALSAPASAAVPAPVVARQSEDTVLDASGFVVAARHATVSADATGRLAAVYVREGSRVRRGDVLARLDTRDLDRQLDFAESQLAAIVRQRDRRRVDLAAARDRFNRLERLRESGFTTDVAFRTADFDVQRMASAQSEIEGEIEVARQRVAIQRQYIRNAAILAPFDGLVIETAAQPGEIVSPISAGGGFTRTGICTLVDINSIEVRVQINEKHIGRIALGQPVEVTPRAYEGLRLPGRIERIMPAAARDTGSVEVVIALLRSDERILPNMSVDVAIRANKTRDDREKAG